VFLSTLALLGGLAAPAGPVEHTLCSGYAECRSAGYGDFGYGRARRTSWWQMSSGSNCTNFVAYRLVRAGLPNRRPDPDRGRDSGSLDAYRWGLVYASRTDLRPQPGSVAWWGRHSADPWGHVAIVESLNADGSLTISEDSATGPDFDWKRIEPGHQWPTGFIHFRLPAVGPASDAAPAPPEGPSPASGSPARRGPTPPDRRAIGSAPGARPRLR
jgi:surface antigen